jgi:hypothetical protein
MSASVDTHPKGEDAQQAPAPLSSAVPQADARNPAASVSSETGTTSTADEASVDRSNSQ